MSMSEPTVSVVTSCYGSGDGYARYLDRLDGAVASVRAQTVGDWEHILVADDHAARYATERYPWVRRVPIRHPDYIEARNIGIEAARGRYIIALDADDRLEPTYVEKTLGAIDRSATYAIAQTDLQAFGSRHDDWPRPEYSQRELLRYNIVIVASLFTKELWRAVGGYEVALFGYEDWNFWLACSKLDPAVAHVHERLFRYHVHDGVASFCGRHDRVLRAMLRLMHPDLYSDGEQARCEIANMPDEVLEVVRKRLGWFPESQHLRTFHQLAMSGRP